MQTLRRWSLVRVVSSCLVLTLLCAPLAFGADDGGSVIEGRGEARYEVPIVVPPGPAGHQPDLALEYNSGEGKGGAGWLGLGWTLSGESRIERSTALGAPYDYDNPTCGPTAQTPCYRNAFSLDGEDLICDTGTCNSCSTASPCRYR